MMENAFQQNMHKLTQDLQNKDTLIKRLFEQNQQLKNQISELNKQKEEQEQSKLIQTLIKDEITVEEIKVEETKKKKKKNKK